MYIEGIYLGTEIDSTFDNMMSSVADYTGSVKTDSPRSFLVELARAVEVSKIIIAIGELYGKNGLINILSKGLDLPLEAVDWKSLGIAPIMNSLLPKGAVPLLSNDDSLAGMILESGSQSIIVLNEVAETRAEMLEMYIEAYIGARSTEPEDETDFFDNGGADEYAETTASNEAYTNDADLTDGNDLTDGIGFNDSADFTDTVVAADENQTADEIVSADTAADCPADENGAVSDITELDGEEADPASSSDENGEDRPLSFDADYDGDEVCGELSDEAIEEYERYYAEKASGDRVGFIEEEDFVLEDEPKKPKKPKKSKKPLLIVIAVLIVLGIIGGYFGYLYAYLPSRCKEDYVTLREYKDDMGSGKVPQEISLVQYGRLYEINEDMLGWLTIDGTNIDYPIVSSAKTGSNYYKNHTFSGVKGTFGTPYFTGEYGIHTPYPRNLAVFGNNTGDGNMFSDLEKYLDPDFCKNHKKITMNSILYDDEWEIVSVMLMDKSLTTAAIDYTESFADKTEIDSGYISALSTYSVVKFDSAAETDDHLLTLITSYSKDESKNVVVTAKCLTNR